MKASPQKGVHPRLTAAERLGLRPTARWRPSYLPCNCSAAVSVSSTCVVKAWMWAWAGAWAWARLAPPKGSAPFAPPLLLDLSYPAHSRPVSPPSASVGPSTPYQAQLALLLPSRLSRSFLNSHHPPSRHSPSRLPPSHPPPFRLPPSCHPPSRCLPSHFPPSQPLPSPPPPSQPPSHRPSSLCKGSVLLH